MHFYDMKGKQETICIKVPKVYDWVVQSVEIPDQSFVGFSGLETLDLNCDQVNEQVPGGQVTAECFLTDETGNHIDQLPSESIVCSEMTSFDGREDINVRLSTGETITLQKVSVLKKGFFVVRITNARGESCTSVPQPFTVAETFFLCAPAGTFIQCEITDFECNADITCTLDNEGEQTFQQVDVSINICQSVQVKSIVTIEIPADMCQPRSDLITDNRCPQDNLPPQCPVIFPG
ncbi:hypothetical protein [Gracilibacillus sp. YIM 98692]|uniref:hypothetical protein n=1 Tax=Gracilibacillus sp. YIM 98692 TaxID=2663532 RepID=UPI0013D72E9C|nr:hypothetical protein [Gracilibacillus sp. YIM 98692]